MKTGIRAAIAILALTALAAGSYTCGTRDTRSHEFTIVTSFYPMYIIARNITRDIPGIRVVNLTANHAGCLHDYQLTPDDMRTLTKAAVVILNGSGMEHFLNQLPQRDIPWRIIDASQHQGLLIGQPAQPYIRFTPPARDDTTRFYETAMTDSRPWWLNRISDTAYEIAGDTPIGNNTLIVIPPHSPEITYPDPHQWVSIGGHRLQLNTLTDSLCAFDTVHAAAYRANAATYDRHLAALQERLYAAAGDTPVHNIIALHGTLNWFLSELGLAISTFALDDVEGGPNAWEMQAIITRIRRQQVRQLIIDQPFPRRVAETIARETGVKIHIIDPCVTGPDDPDAYLKAMERNLAVFKEALQ